MRTRERTMNEIWDSWEWLLREKFEEIDHMVRKIETEAATFSVPRKTVEEFLPKKFLEMKERIVKGAN